MKYVALLRGINVSGNKKVEMKKLKTTLEANTFSNVKTLLNSGNLIFESEKSREELKKQLPALLQKTFGFEIPTLIRAHEEIVKLVTRNPFQSVTVTPETRQYVTFFSETPTEKTISSSDDFSVLSLTDSELCTVITITPTKNTTDLMKDVEKLFGKNVTTRNWNTVVKIAAL